MAPCAPWLLAGFSTKAHVTRALLEAICFQTREVGAPALLVRVLCFQTREVGAHACSRLLEQGLAALPVLGLLVWAGGRGPARLRALTHGCTDACARLQHTRVHACTSKASLFDLLRWLRGPSRVLLPCTQVLDAMRQDAEIEGMPLLRVDGGATKSDLLMQIQVSAPSAKEK